MPRRSGQDPALRGARRFARRLAARVALARSFELGVDPFDLLISNLYPSPRRWPPVRRPRLPSSRSTSAARRWCVARQRTMPQWLSSLRLSSIPSCWRLRLPAASTSSERKALATAACVHTATYDVAVASWMGSAVSDLSEGTGFLSWIVDWQKITDFDMGRTPPARCPLLHCDAARRPEERPTTARQGHVLQQLRRCRRRPPVRRRLRRACRRDYQACESVRHRDRVRHCRGSSKAHACDPTARTEA